MVVLRAEGRGFCAGVDIKEIQARGDEALVGANRGCAAAFAAVYDCEVPVIAAVHGFCLGGGIGLVGNADIVIASRTRRSDCPRWTAGLSVRRRISHGSSRSTGCGRWCTPPNRRRRPSCTTSARSSTSSERDRLVDRAHEIAAVIAAKSPTIIRRAKESLNGIDPVDVKRSYRFEQGFTYELHVRGVADEQRAAFVEKREADTSTMSCDTGR